MSHPTRIIAPDVASDSRDWTWYLAQLKPNGARLATRNLTRQGFAVFNPMHQVTQRRAEQFVMREVQLFPGYLFVGLEPGVRRWGPINGTLGVNRLVGFGGEVATVPPALIAELRQRCDDSGHLQEPDGLVPGDSVRVVAGPFAAFVTQVERIEADRRIWVLLDLMGRATRVRLNAGEVAKL